MQKKNTIFEFAWVTVIACDQLAQKSFWKSHEPKKYCLLLNLLNMIKITLN